MTEASAIAAAFEAWADSERPSLYKNVTTWGGGQVEIHSLAIARDAWKAGYAWQARAALDEAAPEVSDARLHEMQKQFWSFDHLSFDHVAFARALLAEAQRGAK